MVRELIFALLLISFAGGSAAAQQPASSRSVTEDLSAGASFTFKIAPNLPEFTFKIVPDRQAPDQYGNAQTTVAGIEVYRGNSKQPLQHLDGCELNDMEPPPEGSDLLRTVDVNFDGYQDIFLLTSWGATGNTNGCVWLFNPASGRFEFSKDFSELAGFRADPVTKTIFTFEKGGMAGQIHVAQRYKVENKRPLLIWSQSQDWDEKKKQFHCVVEERRDSTMVVVRDEWGTTEEDIGPCDPSKLFQHSRISDSPDDRDH